MRIPPLMLEKPGKLSEDERLVVNKHSAEGFAVLKMSRQLPEEVLDVVRCHHERVDGRGYPEGLKGDMVPLFARVAAIADAYDNMTSDNSYRAAMTPGEALRILRTQGSEEYGRDLVQEFIRCLGIYPVGSVVQLNSGAIAMVISSNMASRLKPVIMLIRDEAGTNLKPRTMLNLASLSDEMLTEKWGIQGMADPKILGLDLQGIVSEEVMT
jgi:HD-GYP domain-containing protein (c-di-GMP phosphodiesterase class II)